MSSYSRLVVDVTFEGNRTLVYGCGWRIFLPLNLKNVFLNPQKLLI